jgi:hemerythrin superfamily protein
MSMTERDAIDVLVADHRAAEALFSRLEMSGAVDQAVLDEVIRELSVHAAIEEQVLYPAVRRQVDGGEALVEHSLEEHQEAKELLASLQKSGADGEETPQLLQQLISGVRQHVREEEGQILPKLERSMSPEARRALGEALEKAKKMAPTRPHPHAPSTPPGNVVAGTAAALIDTARDAVSGRGKEE